MSLIFDPTYKPRLRPVEPFAIPSDNGKLIGLRDRSGLSEMVLSVSPAALYLMAMFDGQRTSDQIRREFLTQFGQPVPVETLQCLIEQLERARFLEGPSFEAYYNSLLADYRRSGLRTMRNAAALGLAEGDGALFDGMLSDADPRELPGPVVGLIAPHLDYPRGRPCYAAAYATLRHRPAPARVVILGTNHFGRSTSVVATACDFQTPLGITRTDRAFLARLDSRFDDLRTFELDHLREHSVELQVVWLQHLFGADSFRIVALLCPDPCGPTGTAPCDGQGVDLRDFAFALRDVLADDPQDTLVVAGADFSHVGAAFGDERRLEVDFLAEVRQRDQAALAQLADNDAEGFRKSVAADANPTRVCGAGCMFTLSTALPARKVTVLGYHQAVDQPTQTCVTCAAVAFT